MIANLNIDRDLTGRYDFNINSLLVDMENILKKYVVIPEGLSFIKGVSTPIYDRVELGRYEDNNIPIHNTPQCPFIAPNIVKDILEIHLVNSHPDSETIYKNKLLNKISPIYDVNRSTSNVDILTAVLTVTNHSYDIMYSNVDLTDLLSTVNTIINKFNIAIGNNFRYIYSIDVNRESFIIYRYITIGEYRYEECNNIKQIEKEYEHDVHGNAFGNNQ